MNKLFILIITSIFLLTIANVNAYDYYNASVYWKFNQSSGNAIDLYGKNNLTNVNSITYTAGKLGNSSVFSTNKYFSLASLPTELQFGTGDWSMCWWMKTTSSSLSGIYTNRPDGASSATTLQFRMTTAGRIELIHNGATAVSTATNKTNTGAWVRVCTVKSGTNLKYYINGSLDSTFTIPGDTYGDISYDLQIGSSDGTLEYYNGELDDFRAYKGYVMNTSDISDDWNGVAN